MKFFIEIIVFLFNISFFITLKINSDKILRRKKYSTLQLAKSTSPQVELYYDTNKLLLNNEFNVDPKEIIRFSDIEDDLDDTDDNEYEHDLIKNKFSLEDIIIKPNIPNNSIIHNLHNLERDAKPPNKLLNSSYIIHHKHNHTIIQPNHNIGKTHSSFEENHINLKNKLYFLHAHHEKIENKPNYNSHNILPKQHLKPQFYYFHNHNQKEELRHNTSQTFNERLEHKHQTSPQTANKIVDTTSDLNSNNLHEKKVSKSHFYYFSPHKESTSKNLINQHPNYERIEDKRNITSHSPNISQEQNKHFKTLNPNDKIEDNPRFYPHNIRPLKIHKKPQFYYFHHHTNKEELKTNISSNMFNQPNESKQFNNLHTSNKIDETTSHINSQIPLEKKVEVELKKDSLKPDDITLTKSYFKTNKVKEKVDNTQENQSDTSIKKLEDKSLFNSNISNKTKEEKSYINLNVENRKIDENKFSNSNINNQEDNYKGYLNSRMEIEKIEAKPNIPSKIFEKKDKEIQIANSKITKINLKESIYSNNKIAKQISENKHNLSSEKREDIPDNNKLTTNDYKEESNELFTNTPKEKDDKKLSPKEKNKDIIHLNSNLKTSQDGIEIKSPVNSYKLEDRNEEIRKVINKKDENIVTSSNNSTEPEPNVEQEEVKNLIPASHNSNIQTDNREVDTEKDYKKGLQEIVKKSVKMKLNSRKENLKIKPSYRTSEFIKFDYSHSGDNSKSPKEKEKEFNIDSIHKQIKEKIHEEATSAIQNTLKNIENDIAPILLKKLIEDVVTDVLDKKMHDIHTKLEPEINQNNEKIDSKNQKIDSPENEGRFEVPHIVSKHEEDSLKPYYLPFSKKNVKKKEETITRKENNKTKEVQYEDVEYVEELSPASKAKFDFIRNNINDPEYIKVVTSGYENPKFVSPIVKNYYTNIKPVPKIEQLSNPIHNSWDSVEYVTNHYVENRYITPTKFSINENHNDNTNVQLSNAGVPINSQGYGFLDILNEENTLTEEEINSLKKEDKGNLFIIKNII